MRNKKIIALIIIVIILVGVVFLIINFNSNKNKKDANNNTNIDNSDITVDKNNNQNSEDKIAIIYFSATGTTKKVAQYIKDATGGELIEIKPKYKYTDEDLNYSSNNSRCTKEQNDSSSRPAIANNISTDSYDVIYLGYPIWWGDSPRIMLTFLDNHNLSGKTVIPFCTSGSSGIETSVSYFKSNYKDVNFLDGKRLNVSKNEVINWVNGLNC